ncbi:MAG: glycosyltransferase family 4 protein [Gammaproteobacteria bacterium]|nr:glycosyltransferase family 4 protein [Gammaproteobacteria bacterium]MCP5136683.1 glycosyltransferase family 4 protein [Gammaproteobacteria bacterium]
MKTIQVPRRFVAHEWGGTETTILQTCRALNAVGHDTRIFTSLALSEVREERMQEVPIRRFPYTYPFWGLSPEAIYDMDRKGGNLLSLSLLWGLLREPGVDLLHAHSGKRLGGIVRTAARLKGIPYVITLHGGFFDVPKGEMDQMLKPIDRTIEWGKPFGALFGSRKVMEDAAAIIAVGENEARAAREKLPHQRIEFLPNGVDSAAFAEGNGEAFRARFEIPVDRKLILHTSRIDYQKNQLALVDALPAILAKNPETHVAFLGPVTVASYRDKLLARIAALGVGAHITLIPGLPPDDPDLKGAFHAADVFCLPSLHEPFGIVILEAWAAGLPVVAAKVGGIPSFTRDGQDVLHINPEQPDDIANAVNQLCADPLLATRLAHAGREKARKEYDWSVIAARLLRIYQEVAA